MNSPALLDTAAWVEQVVVGLNLCPFAKAVMVKHQIRYVLFEGDDLSGLLACLRSELQTLADASAEEMATTLLVAPNITPDFLEFNDWVGVCNDQLRADGWEGVFQLADFHPQYRFAGEPADDVSHYTNRSPHPTLHVLREDQIDEAVKAFPDAAEVFERNILMLRELGLQQMRDLHQSVRRRD